MPRFERLRLILDTITSCAVAIAAGAIIWFVWTNGTAAKAKAAPGASVEDVSGLETTASEMTTRRGAAKVAIVEFSDVQCPFCGQYARETFPLVETEFVKTGVLEYVFRHFPLEALHPNAFKASEAIECAGQQHKRWEMHDLLFANQQSLAPSMLLGHATALSLNGRQFEGCLDGQVTARIRTDIAEGERLGVQATPTLFIGVIKADGRIALRHRISGAVAFPVLKAVVRKFL